MKTLYKRDTQGRIRVWSMELSGDGSHRTISGLLDGEKVTSGWTICLPASQATAEAQAEFEAQAEYTKKLRLGYSDSIEKVDTHEFFQPMLAQKWSGELGWVQPKLDGIRCLARHDGLWTRQGKPIVSVPHVWEAIQHLFEVDPDLILDGELYNHEFKDDFNKITSLVRKTKNVPFEQTQVVQYHVYDLATSGFFDERYHKLARLGVFGETIRLVPTYRAGDLDGLDNLHGGFITEGYEGSIIRTGGAYENKRSSTLLKRKDFLDGEFRIRSVEEGLGNWAGYAKRLVLELGDGRTFGAGVRGNQERLRAVMANRAEFVGKLATIRYFSLTPDGIPRFPVAVDLDRED